MLSQNSWGSGCQHRTGSGGYSKKGVMSGNTAQVLVVESDAETRKLISRLLQGIGVQSILVKDGETALALLDGGLMPGLIILALAMPDLDGYSVLESLRADTRFAGVPVLALSHSIDPEVIRHGLHAGADGYATTAYLSETLLDRVRILLAAGRQATPDTWRMQRTVALDDSDEDDVLPDQDAPRDDATID